MINKQHHMVHYPLCMYMCGPLINMQCLKYELKHGFSKRLAAVNCNFKNICLSIACKHQILQCALWSANCGLRVELECNGSLTSVNVLNESALIQRSLNIDEDSEVFVASQVTVFGREYRPNLYLCVGVQNDTPQFAKISNILVRGRTQESVFFHVKMCANLGFSRHYHSYIVSDPEICVHSVMAFDDLVGHPPLSPLTTYEDHSPTYLCLRHAVRTNWYEYTFN